MLLNRKGGMDTSIGPCIDVAAEAKFVRREVEVRLKRSRLHPDVPRQH